MFFQKIKPLFQKSAVFESLKYAPPSEAGFIFHSSIFHLSHSFLPFHYFLGGRFGFPHTHISQNNANHMVKLYQNRSNMYQHRFKNNKIGQHLSQHCAYCFSVATDFARLSFCGNGRGSYYVVATGSAFLRFCGKGPVVGQN